MIVSQPQRVDACWAQYLSPYSSIEDLRGVQLYTGGVGLFRQSQVAENRQDYRIVAPEATGEIALESRIFRGIAVVPARSNGKKPERIEGLAALPWRAAVDHTRRMSIDDVKLALVDEPRPSVRMALATRLAQLTEQSQQAPVVDEPLDLGEPIQPRAGR